MAARSRLEHGLGDLDPEQVVLTRLEAAEVLGEDPECSLDRCLDDDRRPHGSLFLCGHASSFVGCSTAAL
jgi:hypothetical protein